MTRCPTESNLNELLGECVIYTPGTQISRYLGLRSLQPLPTFCGLHFAHPMAQDTNALHVSYVLIHLPGRNYAFKNYHEPLALSRKLSSEIVPHMKPNGSVSKVTAANIGHLLVAGGFSIYWDIIPMDELSNFSEGWFKHQAV